MNLALHFAFHIPLLDTNCSSSLAGSSRVCRQPSQVGHFTGPDGTEERDIVGSSRLPGTLSFLIHLIAYTFFSTPHCIDMPYSY